MKKHSLVQSFVWAWEGVVYAIAQERNMKIHLTAALGAVLVGVWLGLTRLEWGMLLLTIFFVLVAEVINTAVEKTVDMITTNYHPLARVAKNVAAGAVLLSAINAVIIGLLIFGPRLW